MIPIIWWELRQRRYYLFWWCVGVALIVSLLLLIYPSIRHQAQQLDTVVRQVPRSVRSLKGINGDIASPIGYLNAQVYYATLPLLFSILTIGLGSSLLARDEQQHTLELLLARPVSRARVITGKALAGLAIAFIVGMVTALTIIVLAKIVDMSVSTPYLLLTSLFCICLAIAFGAIAFALTAMSGVTRRVSIAAATFVAFGGYLLTSLANSTDWMKTPAAFLPYHYYAPTDMLHGTFSGKLVLYLAAILVATALISVWCFQRRDIE